jgi:glycosyltransferase involved in cell wall biosynthesis
VEERKKILFMSSWYPVATNPTHGIFVKRHAEAVALKHDVFVLYAVGAENPPNELVQHSSAHFSEDIYFYDKSNKKAIQKLKQLGELYDQGFDKIVSRFGKPDLIHLNVIFPAGIFALRFSKKYKIPLVVTEHWTGYLPEDGSYKGLLKKYFTQKVVAQAEVICPVTNHLAKQMQAHKLNGNYIPVPNVVDTEFFSLKPVSKTTETVFLHLSSFDERQKNPRSILEAFKQLSEKNTNCRLIMAGDGENIDVLRSFAAQLKIAAEKIDFHFRPQGKTLLQLFHSADALVLNSNYENLPVVLLEAMSCGVPVISSDVGGIAGYINESNGILFSPPSVQNLLTALQEFISNKNKFDNGQIRSFAVENFSRKTIAGKFDSVYKSILEK